MRTEIVRSMPPYVVMSKGVCRVCVCVCVCTYIYLQHSNQCLWFWFGGIEKKKIEFCPFFLYLSLGKVEGT